MPSMSSAPGIGRINKLYYTIGINIASVPSMKEGSIIAAFAITGGEQEAGDAEVVVLAVSALEAVGVRGLTVDLSLPTLVPAVTQGLAIEGEAADSLRRALDRKDAEAVSALSGAHGDLFEGLLRAGGPADQALAALRALGLPEEAQGEIVRVRPRQLDLLESNDDRARLVVSDPDRQTS